MRFQDFYKCFVLRVRQVHFTTGFAVETHEKYVCEALCQSFGAVVGTPFKSFYLFDFGGELTESIFHFLHLRWCCRIFEFEKNNVAQHFFRWI
ncbi:hypothetical protein D3C86_1944160 [compost metagenome]